MRHTSSSEDRGILPTHHTQKEPHTRKQRSPFVQNVIDFFRHYGLDWFTILFIGFIALMIDKYVPDVGGRAKYFRLLPDRDNTSPNMESFGHPYRKQIITFWTSAGLDAGVPALFIGTLELLTRGRFDRFARGMLGAFNSVIMCCFIQIIVKTLAGGFRPNFLELCQPVPNGPGKGWDGSWYQWDICTGDPQKIAWALESFPSGHVATSFAAGVYLSLYINAKLKVFSDYRSNPLVIIFCLTPLTLAILMGGAIHSDMSHHWYDILAGAVLGTFIAFLAYRNSYVSIFNWRTNHIGLDTSRRWERRPEYEYDEYDVKLGFPKFSRRKI